MSSWPNLRILIVGGSLLASPRCSSSPEAPTPSPSPGPANVIALSVTGSSGTGQVGQTVPLVATAQLSNGATQNVTSTATWQSSNAAVASVSSAGVATLQAVGETEIRATVSNISGVLRMTVTPAAPAPPDIPSMYGTYNVTLRVARQTCPFPVEPGATGVVTLNGLTDGSRLVVTVIERGTSRTYNGSIDADGSFRGSGGGVIAIKASTGLGGEVGSHHDYTGGVSGRVTGRSIGGTEAVRFGDPCPGAVLDLVFNGSR